MRDHLHVHWDQDTASPWFYIGPVDLPRRMSGVAGREIITLSAAPVVLYRLLPLLDMLDIPWFSYEFCPITRKEVPGGYYTTPCYVFKTAEANHKHPASSTIMGLSEYEQFIEWLIPQVPEEAQHAIRKFVRERP